MLLYRYIHVFHCILYTLRIYPLYLLSSPSHRVHPHQVAGQRVADEGPLRLHGAAHDVVRHGVAEAPAQHAVDEAGEIRMEALNNETAKEAF